jgi:CRP/FNR family transcriptional regulator, cyclic AMP receptor protein
MTISKLPSPNLDNNILFMGLTLDERAVLLQNAQIVTYNKHSAIFEPNKPANKAYILMSGSVKITVHAERKDIIKYMVRPGMLFGESFLTGELVRRDFAYAMEDNTDVLEIDAQIFLMLSRKNFSFAQALLHFLGERLRHTEHQLERVVLKDSKSRIMEYLHQMGTEQGRQVGMETLVKHNMTHQDIADVTGTSRQMVTAVLNQLKRENVLYFNRKKILFRDLNALPAAS